MRFRINGTPVDAIDVRDALASWQARTAPEGALLRAEDLTPILVRRRVHVPTQGAVLLWMPIPDPPEAA